MESTTIRHSKKGQTAVEYLLLLGIVVTVVLVGFSKYLPRAQQASNIYFQRVGEGVLGEPNSCGDGTCDKTFEDDTTCCVDCNFGKGYCGASELPPEDPSLPKPEIPKIPSF